MRTRYWSCGKLADKIRGTPKLKWATPEEWDVWKETARKRKVRFWLAEEGLTYLQDFFDLPKNTYHRIMYYTNNRWVTKTHVLKSTLPKGGWYDLDTRIIECLFTELVDFVEIGLAWHHIMWSREEIKEAPWWRRVLRYRAWRSPSHGINHLEWASKLTYDDIDKDNPLFGKPTHQALASIEIKALYDWWKARQNRPDAMDASGWSEYCKDKKLFSEEFRSIKSKEAHDKLRALEQQYEDEDTIMLIRLIKIRKNLWT